jgi:hypothetical protein
MGYDLGAGGRSRDGEALKRSWALNNGKMMELLEERNTFSFIQN